MEPEQRPVVLAAKHSDRGFPAADANPPRKGSGDQARARGTLCNLSWTALRALEKQQEVPGQGQPWEGLRLAQALPSGLPTSGWPGPHGLGCFPDLFSFSIPFIAQTTSGPQKTNRYPQLTSDSWPQLFAVC